MDKKILDMTCGARSIWFDKHHPAAVYCDKRQESYTDTFGTNPGERHLEIAPDIVCDFTALPFPDETFSLVVFDPPHLGGRRRPHGWSSGTANWTRTGRRCSTMVSRRGCAC